MNKQLLLITEAAAGQIKSLLGQRENPALGIRVGIKSGGCSGLSYYFEYADAKNPFDEVIESHGIKVLIDPKALMYLLGSTMDYVDSTFKSGFTFTNPNEKGQCGCGKSFNV